MDFNELKKNVQKQYRNKEITDEFGLPITVKSWKKTNAKFRDQLRAKGVKLKSVFYNPNDNRIYIKQSFRTVKIDGLPQIQNTYEDIMCFICDEKHIKGYWDDEYITIHFIQILKGV